MTRLRRTLLTWTVEALPFGLVAVAVVVWLGRICKGE